VILRGFGGVALRPGTPAYDAAWIDAQIQRAPDQWQGRFKSRYMGRRSKLGEFAANTWLREACDAFGARLLPLSASDDEVCAAAARLANECRRTAAGLCGGDQDEAYRIAARFCTARGIEAPGFWSDKGPGPALARMACASWWRRRLRAMHGRQIEAEAVRIGIVHGRPGNTARGVMPGERYVSDANAQRRAQQRERNAAALASMTAVNQDGDEFTLADLAERSTANPAIRRGELMTRIAGFEHVARGLGHAAEFWTATCPTEYHAQGGRNAAFKGATARDGQAWLCASWARFRAWAGRKGVRFYGFRVAEPHQDGCPHWHLLLFMPAGFVARARAKFRRYWLRVGKVEKRDTAHETRIAQRKAENADDARRRFACKFVRVEMDAARSAAGYISKYIAKNIDGYSVQTDLYGHDAVQGAARIDAWAATHGIRQFQQVGGAPVGVWRELRRVKGADGMTGLLSAAVAVADVKGAKASEGWADYVRLQGGPVVRRADLRIRVAVTDDGYRWSAAEGLQRVADLTRYGEIPAGRVWGVRDCAKGISVVSRRFDWTLSRRGRDPVTVSARSAQPAAQPRTRVNNCTRSGVRAVSGPALKPETDDGLQMLQGSDLAAWAKRRDVRPEFVRWWIGGGGDAAIGAPG